MDNFPTLFKPMQPPRLLFHGTSAAAAEAILESGHLKPMSRQYVHLSSDKATALIVGKRKTQNTEQPTILQVLSKNSKIKGSEFPFSLGRCPTRSIKGDHTFLLSCCQSKSNKNLAFWPNSFEIHHYIERAIMNRINFLFSHSFHL